MEKSAEEGLVFTVCNSNNYEEMYGYKALFFIILMNITYRLFLN